MATAPRRSQLLPPILPRTPALITFGVLSVLFVPQCLPFLVPIDVQHFSVLGAPVKATLAPSSPLPPSAPLSAATASPSQVPENVTTNSNHSVAYSVSIDAVHLPHPNESDQESSEDWPYDTILFFSISFELSCVVRVLIFIYCCLVIGYLCDEYFVPALESIGEALNFSNDLIGAILIPFGTSGPEIFSSAVGVFFAQTDIGTGAIIGSAVFNMLAIPAACGLAAVYFTGHSISLDEMPILRDLVFYIVSIVVLILVVKDNTVDLLDASLLILLFVIYIAVMFYNAKFSKSLTPCTTEHVSVDSLKSQNNHHLNSNYQSSQQVPVITINNGNLSKEQRAKIDQAAPNGNNNNTQKKSKKYKMKEYLNRCQEILAAAEGEAVADAVAMLYQTKPEETAMLLNDFYAKRDKAPASVDAKLYAFIDHITKKCDDEKDRSAKCKGQYEKLSEEESNGFGFTDNCILRWLLMPFSLLFFLTLPQRFNFVTFFISIVWLSALSYVTVWSISGLGDYLGIPPAVSGITILAAGSAVPDLVTAVIVIKKTRAASMGICAAIASNIFAILLGLGLPWTIRILLNWAEEGHLAESFVVLESSALPFTACILLATVFVLYFTFRLCSWKISTRFALICMVIHVLFMVSSSCLEVAIGSSANS